MTTLNKVDGPDDRGAVADVVFVHGLGGDPVASWTGLAGFWPRLLADECRTLSVWSLGYPDWPVRWGGRAMQIPDRALNLLAQLHSEGIGVRPLCFVAHSLGGLLVKSMLRRADGHSRYGGIAANTRGVVFMSTPHTGVSIARALVALRVATPVVEDLSRFDAWLRELNSWYRDMVSMNGLENFVVFETRPTYGVVVVDAVSADPGIRGVDAVPIDASHVSIAKPPAGGALGPVNQFVRELICEEVADRYRLVPKPWDIVDRDEDVAIVKRMLTDAPIVVIDGPVGVGTSSVAQVVAQDLQAAGRTVAWVELDPDCELDDLLESSEADGDRVFRASQRRGRGEPVRDERSVRQKLKTVIGQVNSQSAVLFIDEFDDNALAGAAVQLLEMGAVCLSTGRIVVIAHSTPSIMKGSHGTSCREHGVPALVRPFPQVYLERHLAEYSDVLPAFARSFGGHPMSLNRVVAWVRTTNPTQTELLERVDEIRSEIEDKVFDDMLAALPADERQLFLDLSVFAAPFTREAAFALGDAPEASAPFDGLVSKLLISPWRPGLYRIHSSLRPWAYAALVKTAERRARTVHARAASWYLTKVRADKRGPTDAENVWLAYNHFRSAEEPIRAATVIREARQWLTDLGRYDRVLRMLTEVVDSGVLPGPDMAAFYVNMAQVHERRGQFDDAAVFLSKAEHELGETPPNSTWVQLYIYYGAILTKVPPPNFPRAFECAEKALALSRQLNLRPEEAKAHNLLGLLYGAKQEWQSARTECLLSEEMYVGLALRDGIAAAKTNLGVIAYEMGDWVGARKYYEDALGAVAPEYDPYGQQFTLANLAELMAKMGECAEAVRLCRRALRISKRNDMSLGSGLGYANLGVAFLCAGKPAPALKFLLKSWREYPTPQLRFEVLRFIVEAHLELPVSESVLPWLQELVDEAHADEFNEAIMRRLRGRVLVRGGGLVEAERELESSLETLNREGVAFEIGLTRLAMAELYCVEGLGKEAAGQEALAEAEQIFVSLNAGHALRSVWRLKATYGTD